MKFQQPWLLFYYYKYLGFNLLNKQVEEINRIYYILEYLVHDKKYITI